MAVGRVNIGGRTPKEVFGHLFGYRSNAFNAGIGTPFIADGILHIYIRSETYRAIQYHQYDISTFELIFSVDSKASSTEVSHILDVDGDTLLVVGQSGTIYYVDAITQKVILNSSAGQLDWPMGVYIHDGFIYAFTHSTSPKSIVKIDINTLKVVPMPNKITNNDMRFLGIDGTYLYTAYRGVVSQYALDDFRLTGETQAITGSKIVTLNDHIYFRYGTNITKMDPDTLTVVAETDIPNGNNIFVFEDALYVTALLKELTTSEMAFLPVDPDTLIVGDVFMRRDRLDRLYRMSDTRLLAISLPYFEEVIENVMR